MAVSKHGAKVAHEDQLVDDEPRPGQVILHQGDAVFAARARTEGGKRLPPAESIFLRLIAYLVFADAVCVPARHLLTNKAAFSACQLAEPLVVAGLVRAERRAEVDSFAELATALSLGTTGRSRGEWLDQKAGSNARIFNSITLGSHYREILIDDLEAGMPGESAPGALRTAMGVRASAALASHLDRAREQFASDHITTPDGFARAVGAQMPDTRDGRAARNVAHRWAMARYFLTPTLLDSLNTRELPPPAAKLLAKGNAIDLSLVSGAAPAPAEAMHSRLTMGVAAHDVRARAREYCEALLGVRARVPRAREVFADVTRRSELGPVSSELARLMQEELNRQQRVQRSSGDTFTLVTSLLVGVGALGAVQLSGLDNSSEEVGLSLAAGGLGAVAANRALNSLQVARDRRRRPWTVAIESLASEITWSGK